MRAIIPANQYGTYLATIRKPSKNYFMGNTGKILTALAAGAAIGIVTGILLAPDKGSETRKKIKEKGKKFTNDVKDKFRKGKEKFDDLKENIIQTVKEKTEEFN
jgi:gas vesicle protein